MELVKIKVILLFILVTAPLLSKGQSTQLTYKAGVNFTEFQGGVLRYGGQKPTLFQALNLQRRGVANWGYQVGVSYSSYEDRTNETPLEFSIQAEVVGVDIGGQFYFTKPEKRFQAFSTLGVSPSFLLNAKWQESYEGEVASEAVPDTRPFQLSTFLHLQLAFSPQRNGKFNLQAGLRGTLSLTHLEREENFGRYSALTPTLGLAYRL